MNNGDGRDKPEWEFATVFSINLEILTPLVWSASFYLVCRVVIEILKWWRP